MKTRQYRFRIVPVSGKPFEVVKAADNANEAYDDALKLYGQFSLDILPATDILRKSTKEKRP